MAKEVSHMRIECADNGGYMAETHFKPPANTGKGGYSGSGYIKPETKAFGEDEGAALHEHIGKTLGIKAAEKDVGKKPSNSEVESKTFERKEKKSGKEEKE